MKRKIYVNFICLILLSVLTLSVLLGLVVYNVSVKQEKTAIKDLALTVSDFLNKGLYQSDMISDYADYISGNADTARLTIMAPDGSVLIDSKTDASTLENHGDREEFKEAVNNGSGESERYSDTLKSITYYYTLRLSDGNVLRISKTLGSIKSVFISVLPLIFLATVIILLIAEISARKLTKNILKPLNEADFIESNAMVYDEFAPFLKKIELQKREINANLTAIKNRTDTIETITKNMKEGLVLLDNNGIILIANKGVEKIFGEKEIVGKSILHLCRESDFHSGVQKCLTGTSTKLPSKKNGKIYNVYFNPVLDDGKITGAAVLFFDITDRYKAEKQRREFSANVSHELKTPLTTISALAEMIGNGMAKQEDIKDFSEKISFQTKRLINIVDDIIRLSEFDEGDTTNNLTEFDVFSLADSVALSLAENAKNKNIIINTAQGHLKITANKQMIDELLFNLIDNGIKYNKDGGTVNVNIYESDGYCVISVSDTGIGIPEKHRERVFERFYRVDKSRSKKTGGTGLGLSIVKHIAEYHGGWVELESVEGEGSTVKCFIK